jgi:hypothetical protein
MTHTTTSHTFSPSAHHGDELGTGAKAGIGVGAAVAGLVLIAALSWLILRSKRRRTVERQYGQLNGERGAAYELESKPEIVKAPDGGRPIKADDQNIRAELHRRRVKASKVRSE